MAPPFTSKFLAGVRETLEKLGYEPIDAAPGVKVKTVGSPALGRLWIVIYASEVDYDPAHDDVFAPRALTEASGARALVFTTLHDLKISPEKMPRIGWWFAGSAT